MTPERWQQINDLYHSSLERDASERAAFIEDACDNDEDLSQEVKSLVASHELADSFIEEPVFGAVARLLVADDADPMTGRSIGHYDGLSKIGTGGMGEVYQAQDTKLGRKVAIKLLPGRFTLEADRVRRFQHEARSASALNHPNIITIYEIGEIDNRPYIATEFVDGETLRQLISNGNLTLSDALDVAIQITGALKAAHEAGIVHRDIKPDNVMVRSRDGIAKVLDFGLAKLTDQPLSGTPIDSDASTVIETGAGMIMGTISYMSPEQARGLSVDARTDIFSFGIVLYEMISGLRPFAGPTTSDTLAAILHDDPAPLSIHWPDIPRELERIVARALEKDVEDRYQTIDELAGELRSLKQELETQASPQLSEQLDWDNRTLIYDSGNPVTSRGSRRRQTQSGKNKTLKTFSVQYLVSEIKVHKTGVMMAVGPLLLIIIAAVYFLRPPTERKTFESLAIMPFSFSSSDPSIVADPDREYLSDGITESLINNLSQLPEMKVIASSSMFRYKGQQTDPRKIGNELGVQAILTGRIVQRGENLSISVELVDTKDNRHIWGQQYDRKVADLLVVQRDIAKEIADQLRLTLTGADKQQLAKSQTENSEAFQLYLRGRYFWNKRSGNYQTAIDYFNQAIEKDPNFAHAYAGIADCYNVMGDFQGLPPEKAYSKARDAANKALAIDSTLAEAHASLAWVRFAYDWDWPGAEQEFKRAVESNPNYATAHQWYAEYLSVMGRHEEAIKEIKRAQELDPLSLIIRTTVGQVFHNARQYDQAIAQLQQAIEMDPSFLWSHRNLGLTYEQKRMYEEAIIELEKVLDLSKGTSGEMALGHAYAKAGKKDKALKMIERLKAKSQFRYVAAYKFVMIYTGLGDKDNAFAWLEKAYMEHSSDLKNLKVDPRFDNLRSDPRFADLLRRMKLE